MKKIFFTVLIAVNIYPLIAKILGLTYTQKIDGKEKFITPILKLAN